MARKSFGHYANFLEQVSIFWERVGATFSFGEWTQAKLLAEKAEFEALNAQIAKLEFELALARGERDFKCRAYEKFNERLLGAAVGTFGSQSIQAAEVPRLMKVGPGRPNKAAQTRKANTLKRKAAARAARELEIHAAVAARLAAEEGDLGVRGVDSPP